MYVCIYIYIYIYIEKTMITTVKLSNISTFVQLQCFVYPEVTWDLLLANFQNAT